MKLTDPVDQRDYYLEWSTITDTPVTYGQSLEKFKEYYREEYGRSGMKDLEARLARVEQNGVSGYLPFDNLASYFSCNRAAPFQKNASFEDILEIYCRNQKSENETPPTE